MLINLCSVLTADNVVLCVLVEQGVKKCLSWHLKVDGYF